MLSSPPPHIINCRVWWIFYSHSLHGNCRANRFSKKWRSDDRSEPSADSACLVLQFSKTFDDLLIYLSYVLWRGTVIEPRRQAGSRGPRTSSRGEEKGRRRDIRVAEKPPPTPPLVVVGSMPEREYFPSPPPRSVTIGSVATETQIGFERESEESESWRTIGIAKRRVVWRSVKLRQIFGLRKRIESDRVKSVAK